MHITSSCPSTPVLRWIPCWPANVGRHYDPGQEPLHFPTYTHAFTHWIFSSPVALKVYSLISKFTKFPNYPIYISGFELQICTANCLHGSPALIGISKLICPNQNVWLLNNIACFCPVFPIFVKNTSATQMFKTNVYGSPLIPLFPSYSTSNPQTDNMGSSFQMPPELPLLTPPTLFNPNPSYHELLPLLPFLPAQASFL